MAGTGAENSDGSTYDIEADYIGSVYKHGADVEHTVYRDNILFGFTSLDSMPATFLGDSGDIDWLNTVEHSKKLRVSRDQTAPAYQREGGLDVEVGFFRP